MTIKERIKELADSRNISLPALESALGFGNSTIVKWDKSTPNVAKLQEVANYFGVTLDYLVNGDSNVATDSQIQPMYFSFAKELQNKNISNCDLDKLMKFYDLMNGNANDEENSKEKK